MLHPQYEGHLLTTAEREIALEHANIKYPHIVPEVMKFHVYSKPFIEFQFKPDVTSSMSPADCLGS